jgi:hypothetical protein
MQTGSFPHYLYIMTGFQDRFHQRLRLFRVKQVGAVIGRHLYTVMNITIARKQFGNTSSRGKEQTLKSIASQQPAEHTIPWQRTKQ